MKRTGFCFLLLCCWSAWALEKAGFPEVWAYLLKGEETNLTGKERITDLCYFGIEVGCTGRIKQELPVSNLSSKIGEGVRKHLVVHALSSKGVLYFALSKDLSTRWGLVSDIIRFSSGYDGVQIDFEDIRPEEKEPFLSFLRLLRKRLDSKKMLSVAVKARTRTLNDPFDYEALSEIADKIIVMAYDEHWRTGPPGPVASLSWCRRVNEHASKTIPVQKRIMGIPLYGRVWPKESVPSSLRYEKTQEWLRKYRVSQQRTEEGIPFFEVEQKNSLIIYYEDMETLCAKLRLYEENKAYGVAFWRIGQGPVELWEKIQLSNF